MLFSLEFNENSTDSTGVHDKLAESFELNNLNNEGDQPSQNSDIRTNGLSIFTAGIFIVGEICGAGAISFPQALSKTGITGK